MEPVDTVSEAVTWLGSNDPQLVELDLQCQRPRADGAFNQKIRAAGARRLAAALAPNETLVVLDLTGNGIGDEGATALADALSCNSTLRTLALGYNGITAAGAREIANACGGSTGKVTKGRLQQLDLSGNNLCDDAATALAAVLASNYALTDLRLQGAAGVGDAGASSLATALTRNTVLSSLWLGRTSVTYDGALALGKALRARSPPPGGALELRGVLLAPVAEQLGLPARYAQRDNDDIVAALPDARRKRIVSFVSALHPRLGESSPARELDAEVMFYICRSFRV